MKALFSFIIGVVVCGFLSDASPLFAQGTAFTYQGWLSAGGGPANGLFDFTFALFNNNSTNTGQVGSTLTNTNVGVTNGLFTVTLDFGAVFTGNATWLAIGVRTNGGAGFTALSPLQELTPTPYAIYTPNAGTAASAGSVLAANIVGTVSAGQLPSSVITNGASGVNITGTFSGNGAGVTNVTLGTFGSSDIISWGNFFLSSSPNVGARPISVCAADVNGDGKIDLICANQQGDSLIVLTNNGSGGFVTSGTYVVGNGPYSVCAADVNGDGKADLICANGSSGTLTVLTNNGGGGFVSSGSYGVGNDPASVCAADVNGDGKVDLICANQGNNTLTVLTNNGSGGFVSSETNGVEGPRSVCAADVNGDGKIDLICATGNGMLTVFIGNGRGGFVYNAAYPVGYNPTSVCAADVNGDGKVDLISANQGNNTLTVLTNNGSGGFVSSGSYGVGNDPASVCAADVNGDGKVDLICANQGNNTLTVLTNNGSGGFVSSGSYGVGYNPTSVCAADVNGDGKVDLISANFNSDSLTVLLNTPLFSGAFSGNGAGLTSLNATNLTGALPAISGASLTALNASQLTSGTVPLAQLSPDVALLDGSQTFSGADSFSGSVGIGTNSPSAPLDVYSSGFPSALIDGSSSAGTWSELRNTSAGGTNWIMISTGSSNGEGPGKLLFDTASGPGSPTGNVLTLQPNGNVGIGTFTPAATLDVAGDIHAGGTFNGDGSGLTDLDASQLTTANTGYGNFFIGPAGNSSTSGLYNTANGLSALNANTTGSYNTANGASALYNNTSGSGNTAGGSGALYQNTTGNNNTANGSGALNNNTNGNNNTANGSGALYQNTSGSGNTANGSGALNNNTTGNNNTANGSGALNNNTNGNNNTANGSGALNNNTTGNNNVANGSSTLSNNTSGSYNTANGSGALNYNTSGVNNSANGSGALSSNTNGANNTADGVNALYLNTSGSNNVALGYQAGYNITGSANIDMGNQGLSTDNGIIRLGDIQTAAYIAGVINGNGAGLINLPAASLTGALPAVSGASLTELTAANLTGALPAISGASLTELTAANLTGALPAISGANLTSLNASQLTSGRIPLAQLPPAIAFLSSNQTFTGQNTFSSSVGIGTDSPAASLDVTSSSYPSALIDGSASAGTWSELRNTSAGGTNWVMISTADGNGEGAGKLLFTTASAPNAISGHILTLQTNGNVGIGTTSPSYTLQVNGSVAGVGAYNNISDSRYKTNITQLTHALDKIMAMRGVEYNWRTNAYPQINFDGGTQLGFVAQELKDILPEAVTQDAQGYYSIAYSKVIPVLVEAVKDQQKEMEQETQDKNAEIERVKVKADSLEKQVNELKQMVQSLVGKK